jgi:transposase
LINHLREGKEVFFLDETSTHMWEKLKKTWMESEDPISIVLPTSRGNGLTILGAISNKRPGLTYTIASSTNSAEVLRLLEKMQAEHRLKGAVIVLDNHRAHYSIIV